MSENRKQLIENGIKDKINYYDGMIKERETKFARYSKDGYLFSGWGKEIKEKTTGIPPKFQEIDYSRQINIDRFYNLIRPFYLRSYHQDEQQAIQPITNMNPRQLNFNPKHFIYGGAYIYPTAVTLGIFNIAGFFKVQKDLSYYFENPDEMAKMYISGRLLIVVSIFFQVIILFFLCKKFSNGSFAFFLCLAYLVSPFITANKNLMKPHLYAQIFNFLMIITIYKMSFFKTIKIKFLIIAGFFIGFAAGSNLWNAILYLLPAVVILFSNNSFVKKLKFWIILGISIIFGFILANPYIIVDLKNFYYEMIFITFYAKESNPSIYNAIFSSFPKYLTLMILTLIICYKILISKISIIKSSQNAALIISSSIFIFLYFIYLFIIRLGDRYAVYYFPTVYPYIFILPALLYEFFSINQKKFMKIILILTVIFNLFISIQFQMDYYMDSNKSSHRIAAGDWINNNIPPNTVLGLIDSQPQDIPSFSFANYRIFIYPSQYSDSIDVSECNYIICSDYADRMEWVNRLVASGKYKIIKIFKSERLYYKLWGQYNTPIYALQKI